MSDGGGATGHGASRPVGEDGEEEEGGDEVEEEEEEEEVLLCVRKVCYPELGRVGAGRASLSRSPRAEALRAGTTTFAAPLRPPRFMVLLCVRKVCYPELAKAFVHSLLHDQARAGAQAVVVPSSGLVPSRIC